ncbi:MAG: helix-turn-helix domain-containing protein [Rhodospirillales bacterium]|nr:helix-turn-helix domain-containing protein [Rhodospirillales bacterium]
MLCAAYGISRKTGYKWLARYRAHGPAGLEDLSRAPRRHGRSMAPETAAAIVALRRERPHWGPRKLRGVLMREHPGQAWPAASTMGELLRAEGLVRPRRRRRLNARLDLEYGRSIVFFTWAGFDEMDEVNGSGSAELLDDGSLEIEFAYHLGDEATLKAERATFPAAC